MKSGTYWEYFCPGCGWAPSQIIPPGQEAAVKQQLEEKVKEHNKKCKKFKQP